jgi:hypothetical protein
MSRAALGRGFATLAVLVVATACTASVTGTAQTTTRPSTHPATQAATRPVRTELFRTSPSQPGYRAKIWAEDTVHNCATHATSAVRTFLTSHPCTQMQRQVGTTRIGGRTVGFVDERVSLAGYLPATQFAKVEARSGSIADLLRDGHRLPDGETAVPDDATFTVGGQDQTRVVVQAWYLAGHTPKHDAALAKFDFTVTI